ncbi:MAG: IMP dehydrogenase [Bacteroidetes bacterium]|nr:IMP dehydrogenase [Bacteroidota bacterium]
MKFDFDDILLKPATTSDISSRSEINPFDENKMLPLMTAPMDTVVCNKNINTFQNNGIYTIIPRTLTKDWNRSVLDVKKENNGFIALGLDQFIKVYIDNKIPIKNVNRICIDIANGHMKKLVDIIFESKQIHGDKLVLMVGSVANPNTYFNLSGVGADFVRIGVGSGAACITTQQTGIGYPLASLIHDINSRKGYMDTDFAKIVLDGGCKKYSDIIKAISLGSDYIILGSILNKALESAGDTFSENVKHETWTQPGEQVNQFSKQVKVAFENGLPLYKKYRGMSTKAVQEKLGNQIIRTSEGVSKIQTVEYTVGGWVENFKHYLSSAMSYTNSRSLKDFIGVTEWMAISQNSLNRFKK